MDRDTAVTRIQDGLGFRTGLSDKIILRLQEEQRDLERGKTLPDFLLLEGQTLAFLSGTSSVALPASFLRRSDRLPRYTPTGVTISQTIPWREYDEAYETFSASDPAGPKVAVIRNSTILFFPAADTNYTITWDYYAKAALLTSNIENLWLANAPELLIGGAGLRMAKDIRNQAAIALFGDMYKQARATWFSETVVQEAEDGPLILGANA